MRVWGLALQQPAERGVEFVVIDLAEAGGFAEAGKWRGGRQRARLGELRNGIGDGSVQHGQCEVEATVVDGTEDAVEAIPHVQARGDALRALRAMLRAAATRALAPVVHVRGAALAAVILTLTLGTLRIVSHPGCQLFDRFYSEASCIRPPNASFTKPSSHSSPEIQMSPQ